MSIRALRPLARAAFAAPHAAVVRANAPVARQISGTNARTFSVSSRWMGNGESDGALAAAIQAEQQFEIEEAANQPEEPEFLTHFKSQGVWDLKTLPGAEDVILTRKFGNEQLELTFQVSEVDPVPVVEGVEAEAEVEEAESTPPIVTASLVISKHGHPNAMSIDLDAGEDGLVISNVAMFERSVAVQKGSEGDWARRERYLGPQFEHLDAGVQEQFSAYLAERGVDDGLAQFILSYAEHKEQTDYVQWLEQVKGFLDA